MALYDNDGNVIERTVGTTVKVEEGSTYWGDGDSTIWTKATIFENGEYVTVQGESAWSGFRGLPYKTLNTIDAPAEVQVAYAEHIAAIKREQARQHFNREAYNIERGNYAIILRGTSKRGRKNQGRHGEILKTGFGTYGPWVLLKDDAGDTFIANEDYVAVIPDWEDAWEEGVDTANVA